MAAKRSRTETPDKKEDDEHASLAAEVFEALTQASTENRDHLLNALLRACSKHQLDLVRQEAIKCGALVQTKSRYQKCNNDLLNCAFKFLGQRDLQAVEFVCKRWRMACLDGGDGWAHALAQERTLLTPELVAQIGRHGINPARLRGIHELVIAQSPTPIVRTFAEKLPQVTHLKLLPSLRSHAVAQLDGFDAIESLVLSNRRQFAAVLGLPLKDTVQTLGVPELGAQLAPRLNEMSSMLILRTAAKDLEYFPPLPQLATLKLTSWRATTPLTGLTRLAQWSTLWTLVIHVTEEKKALPDEFFAGLGNLTALETLEIQAMPMHPLRVGSLQALSPLAQLTNLTALLLPPAQVELEHLSFVSSLTKLTELRLPAQLKGDGIKLLTPLSSLQSLELSAFQDDLTESELKQLPRSLTALDLCPARWNWSAANCFESVLKIAVADVDAAAGGIDDAGLRALLELPKLQQLCVWDGVGAWIYRCCLASLRAFLQALAASNNVQSSLAAAKQVNDTTVHRHEIDWSTQTLPLRKLVV